MSKINKIKLMLQQMLTTFNQVTTDKGILRYDGDEIEVGASVTMIDEEGNESPVEDGSYYLGDSDGRTLVIEGGVIKEIIEKEEEAETTNEEFKAKQEKFNKVKMVFEESYGEKTKQIADAIYAEGYDGWVIEAGDEYAVVEVWDETDKVNKYYRFEISWDAEGNVIVGERQEVKPAFVPVQEDVEKVAEEVKTEMSEETDVVEDIVDEIKEVAEDAVEDVNNEQPDEAQQRIADLEALVEELKARIAELENKPAAEPAQEEFKRVNQVTKTGIAKLDKLQKKLGF